MKETSLFISLFIVIFAAGFWTGMWNVRRGIQPEQHFQPPWIEVDSPDGAVTICKFENVFDELEPGAVVKFWGGTYEIK